ncbi:MAG: 4-carboxymuconolactone decarboxylase [Parasphingorhabdus sp.]|jgi:4-carboxymuconolactone decarboxylase
MPRLPEFNPEELNDTQSKIYNEIVSGPRGKFGGPFYALIQAPGIANETQALGAALRFNTGLDPVYQEIAILTAAKYWNNEVEWNAHVVIAINVGMSEESIDGILAQRMPLSAPEEQQVIHRFCMELLQTKLVSEETYNNTQSLIGIEQVVELVTIMGYFSTLAMLLNTFEIEADPKDGVPPEHLILE